MIGRAGCEQSLPAWVAGVAERMAGSAGAAGLQGMRREVLLCALAVLMNLTHSNAPGAAAVVEGGGGKVAAHLIDSVLGLPELDPTFVRAADR